MGTHLCFSHHLRLVRLLSAFVLPSLPSSLPRIDSLSRLRSAFHGKTIGTSSFGLRHAQCGLLFPFPARRLGHTHAGSSDLWECMDPEVANQSEDRGVYKQDSITPTLSATIKCNGQIADQLVEALMSFGASSVSIEDAGLGGNGEDELSSSGPVAWDREKRQFWKQCQLIALFPPGQDVKESLSFALNSVGITEMLPHEVKEMEHQNWVQQVKDMFQPLKIADCLWIVPKWTRPPDESATNVILDPGLAFGTGDHPTTRLCLQWLNHIVKGGECILDYGTGSGILAISALKLGACRAVGVDIDDVALSSARSNATLNGFDTDVLELFLSGNCGDGPISSGDRKFDVVVANLLLNPLLELSAQLLRYCRPGGLLGISGILESQVEQIEEKYSPYLGNIQVMTDDGWACISGTRNVTQL